MDHSNNRRVIKNKARLGPSARVFEVAGKLKTTPFAHMHSHRLKSTLEARNRKIGNVLHHRGPAVPEKEEENRKTGIQAESQSQQAEECEQKRSAVKNKQEVLRFQNH